MPLRPGMPVADAIHELSHHGSRPRSHEQIVAIAEANHARRAMGGGFGMHADPATTGMAAPMATSPMAAPVAPNPMMRPMGMGMVHGGGAGFRNPRGMFQQFDDGGGITGIEPSVQTMNPMTQNILQRYQSMSPEQLQELVVRLGDSRIGQLASRVLQQKRTMSAAQPTQQQQPLQAPQAPSPQQMSQQTLMAKGGEIKKAADGMSIGMESPWWTRAEERDASNESGFLHGATAGRADAIRTSSPAGSYILPADVVSGIGEGNSLAGAKILDEALNSNPWGIEGSRQHRGAGPPRPPRMMKQAKGGGVQDGGRERIPVMLSHGEYQVSANQVRALGKGNIKDGHRLLDALVLELRKRHVQKLKSLPPPAK